MAIVPDDESVTYFDYIEDIEEGTGWKKCLCDFTGHSTTAEFYDGFEAWLYPNGETITASQLLSYLPSDTYVNDMMSIEITDSKDLPQTAVDLTPSNHFLYNWLFIGGILVSIFTSICICFWKCAHSRLYPQLTYDPVPA